MAGNRESHKKPNWVRLGSRLGEEKKRAEEEEKKKKKEEEKGLIDTVEISGRTSKKNKETYGLI